MKHLLKMLDLSTEEIIEILDLADQLKYELKHGIPHPHLKGKSLGMIFQKASTRTRVSFETGMYQLGGHPLFLSADDLQIGRGEPVQDTARVLSRYLDGIMIRTFEQKEVEDLAEYGSIPIINGLTRLKAAEITLLSPASAVRHMRLSTATLPRTILPQCSFLSFSRRTASMFFPRWTAPNQWMTCFGRQTAIIQTASPSVPSAAVCILPVSPTATGLQ